MFQLPSQTAHWSIFLSSAQWSSTSQSQSDPACNNCDHSHLPFTSAVVHPRLQFTIFKFFSTLIPPPSRQRTLWSCCFWPRPRPALTTLCPMILFTTSTSGSQVLFAVSEFWRRNIIFFLLMLISLWVLRSRHDNYYHVIVKCSNLFSALDMTIIVIVKINFSISLESLHESSPWYYCWNGILVKLVDGHVYGLGPRNLIETQL